jgi:hypothetical protein
MSLRTHQGGFTLVRRSPYARVAGATIRHRHGSPHGCRRVETTAGDLPEEAGIYATAYRRLSNLRAQFPLISCGDQERGGIIRADAVQGEQTGRTSGDERDDELVEVLDLGVQELGSLT